MRRRRRIFEPVPAPQPCADAMPPVSYGYLPTTAPPGQVQALRMIRIVSADPAPFDVAMDHDLTLIWSGTVNGPAMQCGDIVNDAFESLAGVALGVGADRLYSVRLSTAVDQGWMYVTATATASLPRANSVPGDTVR